MARCCAMLCLMRAVQHHDGDGHKNGMRGFHLKMYAQNGDAELEVVLAEVFSLPLHRCIAAASAAKAPVRLGTTVSVCFAATNSRCLTRCCDQRRRGGVRCHPLKWW
jgi:hypothetical protein